MARRASSTKKSTTRKRTRKQLEEVISSIEAEHEVPGVGLDPISGSSLIEAVKEGSSPVVDDDDAIERRRSMESWTRRQMTLADC